MEFISNIPIYYQVVNDIKRKMIKGELKPGEKLQSARELALQYQINPNTAARVYKELLLQNLVFMKRGLGTYLTESLDIVSELRKEQAKQLVMSFLESFQGLGFSKEEIKEIVLKELMKQD